MSEIGQLFVAMTTRDSDDSGTDSSITLIGNVNGLDRLQYTFPDSSQDDQDRGRANLYNVGISIDLDSKDLPSSYFRVGTRGEDAWRPENCFIWGTKNDFSGIVPIGMRLDLTTQSVVRLVKGVAQSNAEITQVVLSTDNNEGDLCFPLLPLSPGDQGMLIRRLLVLLTTADQDDAGTDNGITINILNTIYQLDDIQQPHSPESGQANWYLIPVTKPFVKNMMDIQKGIAMSISDDDAWLPQSVFIFGLDTDAGMPAQIVTLVHIPNWTMGALSTDSSEGSDTVILPITLP